MPSTPNTVNGTVWLVTGCSSGFGRSLSGLLASKGAKLAATARRVRALTHLADDSDSVLKLELDVTNPGTIAAAVDATMNRFGRLDVVVNNAGIGVIGPVEDATDQQTREQFEINVFGLLNVTRAVQPVFRAQRSGCFINFASMAGEASLPSLGIYAGSKFAVEGLSEAIRSEMEPYGVRVMIVEPGPFNTEWIGKNAVYVKQTEEYPAVWKAVEVMKAAYADRKTVGDPDRAADAILSAFTSEAPPFRLALHEMSVESTRAKLKAVSADLDRMEPVSRAVHYTS